MSDVNGMEKAAVNSISNNEKKSYVIKFKKTKNHNKNFTNVYNVLQ